MPKYRHTLKGNAIAYILLIVILMLHTTIGNAQQYLFNNFDITRGLSNNTVFCVQQDKRGFIWMGTADGLNRFDGIRFKVYRNFSGQEAGMGVYYIWKLLLHSDGSLWVATNKGVFIFDERSESFSPVKGIPEGVAGGIAEDATGKIWITVYNELYWCDPQKKEAERYENKAGKRFTDLIVTENNTIWAGTESGELACWQPKQKNFVFYPVYTDVNPLTARKIEKVYNRGNGILWTGALESVRAFNVRTHTVSTLPVNTGHQKDLLILDFIRITADEYWVATKNGIYVTDNLGRLKTIIRRDKSSASSLCGNDLQAFYRDKEGGIWCTSYSAGVSYYAASSRDFAIYSAGACNIKGTNFTSITEDRNGHIWMAGDAGLNQFDPLTKQFISFSPAEKKRKLSGPEIQGLMPDGKHLWIGAFRYGIDILDIQKQQVVQRFAVGPGPYDLKSNRLMCIFQDTRKQTIWIGTTDGIFRYDKKTGQFTMPDYFPQRTPYNCIFESSDGTIWGLSDRLYFYNPKTNIHGGVQVIQHGTDILPTSINSAAIISKDGTCWLGTGNGLVHINLQTKAATVYTIKNGLPVNIIVAIAENDNGSLWLTTPKGVVLFSPQTATVTNYSQTAGLFGGQFSYASSYKAKNGNIYIGTQGAVIQVHPQQAGGNGLIPQMYITDIAVSKNSLVINGKDSLLQASPVLTNSITLSHRQNDIDLYFTALTYAAPEAIRYQYKLEGADGYWHDIKNSRRVNFNNLPPGNYIFKVRSTNSTGIWQQNERTLAINILPPFYRTIWAKWLYVLLCLIAIYLLTRYYKQRLRDQHRRAALLYEIEKEKELYASKTAFFTDIIHELRAPLTLLKPPLEMAMTDSKDLPHTQKYLAIMNEGVHRLATLINQLLKLKSAEAAQVQLEPSNIAFDLFLDELYFVFEPVIKEKRINFESVISDDAKQVYADNEALTKIMTNLLDNAVKYGDKYIMVKAERSHTNSEILEITVASDGRLITAEDHEKIFEPFARLKTTRQTAGTGIGLALAQNLAKLHHGTLHVETKDGLNAFILALPLHNTTTTI